MILPWLQGLAGFLRAPITWLIFVLNLVVCIYTATYQAREKQSLEKIFDNDTYMLAQGEVFAEYIANNTDIYSSLFLKLSDLALAGNKTQLELLGRLAMRDRGFLDNGIFFKFTGDQVLFEYWKDQFLRVRETIEADPVTEWGLGHRDPTFLKWITYQFVHGGFAHLFSNMWFLLIFGSILEPLLGSALFLILYLGSGFIAAGAYIELSGLTGIPLVGASGAVSGIMALYCMLFWKEPTHFLYLGIPLQGRQIHKYIPNTMIGTFSLPAWLLIAFWVVSDLTGYLSTLQEVGGIAHAAHLGGAALGLILGAILRVGSKPTSHSIFGHNSRL